MVVIGMIFVRIFLLFCMPLCCCAMYNGSLDTADLALFEAVLCKKSVFAVKQALNNGADVNVCDEEGCTPLIFACLNNCPHDVVQLLIAKGADVNYRSSISNETPLDIALFAGNFELVKVLAPHSKIENNTIDRIINVEVKDHLEPFLDCEKEDPERVFKRP